MKTYTIWDRQSAINGKEADYFLNSVPFKNCNHDIILIANEEGIITNVECKDILAKVYDINVNLDIDTFMAEYFAKLDELNKQSEQQEV